MKCANPECECENCTCDPCECTKDNPCKCDSKTIPFSILSEMRGGQ